MKRFLFIIGIFLTTTAYANVIDLPSYVSGNDVTISNLNTTNTTVENWANGNVEGGVNIKPGSLVSQDMANSISPKVRWDEAFNDFTYSGMLPVTSANLTSNISAGVSYVSGLRISKDAESHTYTASKDTYVYINEGGYYDYQEVANGASAPSTPSGDLLLAKVVTSGTAITSVSDLRTTSIQITTTTTNFPQDYRNYCQLSRDSSTTFHVTPGQLAIGTTIYSRTAVTSTKTITTGSNWIEGGYAPGGNRHIFLYAYNDSGSSWDFKFSSADPVYSDTSANTGGVLRYYSSGGVNYRAIGWTYLSADTVAISDWSDWRDTTVRNSTVRQEATDRTTSSGTYVDLPETNVNFYSTGGKITVTYDASMDCSSSTSDVGLKMLLNNSSFCTKNFRDPGGASGQVPISFTCMGNSTQGSRPIKLQWKTTGGTVGQPGATTAPRRVIVTED